MAGFTTRRATPADLDAIVDLTAAYRKRLAGWALQWWQPADDADALHRTWLEHVIADDASVVRVVGAGDRVVGCTVTSRRGRRTVVSDIAIDTRVSWGHLGPKVFGSIDERPALTGLAVDDFTRVAAAERCGLERVSSYWIRTSEAGPTDIGPIPDHTSLPDAPLHTFETVDTDTDTDTDTDDGDGDALAFAAPGGIVVAAPPADSPPIYDRGGTVCIADRVVGTNRGPLLRTLVAAAHERGDARVLVVCGHDDTELAALLTAGGFQHAVDVFAWPGDAR